jgi:hypothetical protein
MRYYLMFTLSLGLVVPRALEAQWVAHTRTGVSRTPAAHNDVDLNTALAQQRVARQQRACERSFFIGLLGGAAGGAIAPVIVVPLLGLLQGGHQVLPRAKARDMIPYGALAGSVYSIRETIRCRRQTARRP